MTKKLIFVYNADSSIFSGIVDFVTKVAMPDKYQCNLCMVTYGTFSMKKQWSEYLESLPFDKKFLHRDKFHEKYKKSDTEMPAIFIEENNELTLLISKEEIDKIRSLDQMIALFNEKLAV